MKKRLIKLFVLTMILLTGLLGCKEQEETTTASKEEASTESSTEEENENGPDSVTVDGMSRDILSGMTLEEKVGQMFFVGLDTLRTDGEYGAVQEFTKSMEGTIKVWNPGGVILYSKNMENQKQVKELTKDLMEHSNIPLFIGTEEPGGKNSKIASVKEMNIKSGTSSKKLGEAGDTAMAKDSGTYIASYMKELGFNLNFAPFANYADDQSQALEEERYYSENVKTVANMVSAFIKGLQEQSVSSVLTQFPASCASFGDTRKGSVEVLRTIAELRRQELVPIEAGVKAGADLVMVGHVTYSSITGNQTPASLSKLMTTEILRNEMRFGRIIITDAMNKKAITDSYSVEDAVVKAVKAGVDMLLYPDAIGKDAYQALLQAVKTGKISEQRIDESVLRILHVKIRRGVIPENTDLISR